jgi:hypothetical protein
MVERWSPVVGLVLAGRSQQLGVHAIDDELELGAGVARVGDDGFAAAQRDRQDLERELSLGSVGGHEPGPLIDNEQARAYADRYQIERCSLPGLVSPSGRADPSTSYRARSQAVRCIAHRCVRAFRRMRREKM